MPHVLSPDNIELYAYPPLILRNADYDKHVVLAKLAKRY